MSEFAQSKLTLFAELPKGASKTFDLPEITPGVITVTASSLAVENDLPGLKPKPGDLPDPDDPPKPPPPLRDIKLELMHAGQVVATGATRVTAAATARDRAWQLRARNMGVTGNRPKGLELLVNFPSTHRLRTRAIPFSFFNRAFDEFWNLRVPRPVSVRVHNNKLTVSFAPDLAGAFNLKPIEEDLGKEELDIPGPFNPDVTINDLSTTDIQFSLSATTLPTGATIPVFSVRLAFEDQGEEIRINNFPNVNLRDISMRVDFHIDAFNKRLSFSPRVTFQATADVNNVPSVGDINGIAARKVKEKIEGKLAKRLHQINLNGDFSIALTKWMLGELFEVRRVTSDGSRMLIEYVDPRPDAPIAEPASPPTTPGELAKVDHIVVVMMENRSFDHLLGYLRKDAGRADVDGLTGNEVNVFQGQTFKPTKLTDTQFKQSPCHDFLCVADQMLDKMGGFVANYAARFPNFPPGAVMGYYGKESLPAYDYLAREFAICDRWFTAHPGPTWPNRFVTITGQLNKDAFGQFERDNPDLKTFTPAETPTLFDHLTKRGVSWKYFEHGYSFIRLFTNFTFDETNVVPANDPESGFFALARAGRLPQVTFLDPDFIDFPPGNDDHPPADLADGQRFIANVYNALRANPRSWEKTLLIVTYDEHGGFYDHVTPPNNAAPIAGITQLGPRVPTFVASPWVKPGGVASEVFDHTSIAATILRRFCSPNPPQMGARVAQAKDLRSLLTRTQPRLDQPPLTLPAAAARSRQRRSQLPAMGSADFHELLLLGRLFFGWPPQ
jgi:phospholipase C